MDKKRKQLEKLLLHMTTEEKLSWINENRSVDYFIHETVELFLNE